MKEEVTKTIENIIKEYKIVSKEWKFGNVPVHLDETDIEALQTLLKERKRFYDGDLYTTNQIKNIEKYKNKWCIIHKK